MTAQTKAGSQRALWYSPPTLFLLFVALVNLLWLAAFMAKLGSDRQYVFPAGMALEITSRMPSALAPYVDPLVIAFDLALALAPLSPLLFPSYRRWAAPLGVECAGWLGSGRRLAWSFAGIVVATAVLVAVADHTRLPFIQERVRWATDWFPLPIPIIPGQIVRLEYFLTRVFDARYTFVLLSAAFLGVLVIQILRYWGGSRVAVPVLAGVAAVLVHSSPFYYLNGAEGALAGATLGLIGVLQVAARRYVGGAVILMAAMLIRPEEFFYAALAAILVGWRLARRPVHARDIPWGFGALCIGIVLLHTSGGFAHEWLTQTPGVRDIPSPFAPLEFYRPGGFYVGPAGRFLGEFVRTYPLQLLLTIGGILWAPRDRGLMAFLLVGMTALRPVLGVSGGYYTMLFVPIWALASAGLMVALWDAGRWHIGKLALNSRAVGSAVAGTVLVVNAFGFADLAHGPWTTRANTNWEGVVERLEQELPIGTTLYFRRLSPRYDLERAGRTDITFRELEEGFAGAVRLLSAPGPIALVVARSDLPSVGEVSRLGYSDVVPAIGDARDPEAQFVFLLKRS